MSDRGLPPWPHLGPLKRGGGKSMFILAVKIVVVIPPVANCSLGSPVRGDQMVDMIQD